MKGLELLERREPGVHHIGHGGHIGLLLQIPYSPIRAFPSEASKGALVRPFLVDGVEGLQILDAIFPPMPTESAFPAFEVKCRTSRSGVTDPGAEGI
jgi:hypothetical protein